MTNYIPDELADLQRYMTVKRWKQIEHHITYHPHHTKAALNLEVDPYQAILTSEVNTGTSAQRMAASIG